MSPQEESSWPVYQQAVVCVPFYLGWSGLHKAHKRDRRGETKLETQIHCSFGAKCKILSFGGKSDICKTVGNKKPLNAFFLIQIGGINKIPWGQKQWKKKHTRMQQKHRWVKSTKWEFWEFSRIRRWPRSSRNASSRQFRSRSRCETDIGTLFPSAGRCATRAGHLLSLYVNRPQNQITKSVFHTWCWNKTHSCSWSCLGWMSRKAAIYFVAPISCRLLHKPNWVILGRMYFLPQICLLPAAREVPVRVRPVSNSLWINVSAYFSPHVKEGAWELPPKKKGEPPGRFLGQWCLCWKLHIYVCIWGWIDYHSKY